MRSAAGAGEAYVASRRMIDARQVDRAAAILVSALAQWPELALDVQGDPVFEALEREDVEVAVCRALARLAK